MTRPEPVRLGELLSVAEDEYLYGVGAVRLRVSQLPERQKIQGWVEVTGHEIGFEGERRDERTLFIREEALTKIRSRR